MKNVKLLLKETVDFLKIFRIGIHANKKRWKDFLKIKPLMLKSTQKEEGYQIYRWLIFVIKIKTN